MKKHFTATAFVLDSQNRTLLLWHKRLQRWMPPGGHIDPDETPEETAKRECKEETGLDVQIIGDPTSPFGLRGASEQFDLFETCPEEGKMLKKPFAMLLENIPASEERGEPAHLHMDFLYIAKPIDEKQAIQHAEDEADEMRWFNAEEVQDLDERTEIFGNVKRYILNALTP